MEVFDLSGQDVDQATDLMQDVVKALAFSTGTSQGKEQTFISYQAIESLDVTEKLGLLRQTIDHLQELLDVEDDWELGDE